MRFVGKVKFISVVVERVKKVPLLTRENIITEWVSASYGDFMSSVI
ncbi:hypothetical protein APHNP_0998 [Anaplasma phagocytophilum str. ApNP]|uniref:Uncharacterized protein n=1 Tax=Anaplasma phagocytophilum str. ApNP TaxID=1359153 RepID=A0A0F3NII9_ANAPH|nr:hypothetical protein APHNP_0998 [Anaplasma phagocytophilum str. ApNP]